ncbi:hypothetical protein ACIBG8_39370 [Nonomuraea sp. NPDC050556]|uniref:hypothetical protein n=1 Tax=Nonomuraea sp. NPDC050556 TaxID=3364369 RepID=UPI00379EEFD6
MTVAALDHGRTLARVGVRRGRFVRDVPGLLWTANLGSSGPGSQLGRSRASAGRVRGAQLG